MACGCILGAIASASSSVAAAKPAVAATVPSVELEAAPAELGKARSEGKLLLAARGKWLYQFDTATNLLSRFLESGKSDGKPVALETREFWQGLPPSWMAVSGNQVALASPIEVRAFELDGRAAGSRQLRAGVSSLVSFPSGDWGVALTRHAEARLAKGDDPSRPRVVRLDGKLAPNVSGLAAASEVTGNAAAARALKLVFAPQKRLYAIELANYTIHALDLSLKERGTWKDPKIQLEGGRSHEGDQKIVAARTEQMKAEAEKILGARDPVAVPAPAPMQFRAETFTYRRAVIGAGWDDLSQRLLLLLDADIVGPSYSLDLVDPVTGEVSRLNLRLPAEGAQDEISRVTVGSRYVWLRSSPGGQRTFRLDREELLRAVPVGMLTAEP